MKKINPSSLARSVYSLRSSKDNLYLYSLYRINVVVLTAIFIMRKLAICSNLNPVYVVLHVLLVVKQLVENAQKLHFIKMFSHFSG